MSDNVIKYRQLSDGQKLTPKSDYNYNGSGTTNYVYDFDGSIKQQTTSGHTWIPHISVGKGQYLWTLNDPDDETMVSLYLGDKSGINGWNDISKINKIQLDKRTNYDAYKNEKNTIAFLGTPFKNSGDNDRYAIASFYQSNEEGSGYYPKLLNIDKWTAHTLNSGRGWGSDGGYKDYVFDEERVYFVYGDDGASNQRIISFLFTELYQATIDDTFVVKEYNIQDSAGVNVAATRLWGITQFRMFYQGEDGGTYQLDNYSNSSVGLGGLLMSNTANAMTWHDTTYDTDWIFIGDKTNILWWNRSDGTQYNLTQSVIDANGGNDYEKGNIPVLLFNFSEDDTEIKIRWLASRAESSGNNQVFMSSFDTTINKSSGAISTAVTKKFSITGVQTDPTSQQQLNVWFSHTCNSYGIGKFYNYGLQKQWDINNS